MVDPRVYRDPDFGTDELLAGREAVAWAPDRVATVAFRLVPTMNPAVPAPYAPGRAVVHGSPAEPAAFKEAPVLPLSR